LEEGGMVILEEVSYDICHCDRLRRLLFGVSFFSCCYFRVGSNQTNIPNTSLYYLFYLEKLILGIIV